MVVGVEPGGDCVGGAAEDAGDVADGLALADADVGGGQVEGVAAELGHGDLEAEPSAQRGLVEEHGEGAAGGDLELLLARDLAGLLGGGEAPDLFDLFFGEIGD